MSTALKKSSPGLMPVVESVPSAATESPFFAPPLPPPPITTTSTRPPLEACSTVNSDDSVSTVSSFASSRSSFSNSDTSSSSSDNPYTRLVVIESMLGSQAAPMSAVARDGLGFGDLDPLPANLRASTSRSHSPPGASADQLSFVHPRLLDPSFASQTGTAALRPQSLPALLTSPTLSREITPTGPTATLSTLRAWAPSQSRLSDSALSITPDSSPSPTSLANLSALPTRRASTSNAVASSSQPNQLSSPTTKRPGSSGAYSTTSSGSTRPWVRDPDSTSICSRRSSCWSSSCDAEDLDREDGEVFKVGADGIEFLDQRPEPPGAKIWVDRDDPRQLVVNVMLPGFSLENITVAFRRHHKLHVLADKYGEDGGHYERTISLGPDVSSRSNRAAFDGTTLRVFIERRPPRTAATIAATSTSEPMPADLVGSPTPSIASLSLASPDLDRPAIGSFAILSNDTEAPLAMCSTGPLEKKNARGKPLTGPEGARAAARAARDEAMQRAKEAAKALPKVGRKLPFRREKDRAPEPPAVSPARLDAQPLDSLQLPERSGTIKGRSSSHSSSSLLSSSSSEGGDASSPATSIDSATQPSTRPKFRGSNLTLRASDKATFLEASMRATSFDDSVDGLTPRVEKGQLNFPPFAAPTSMDERQA